LNVISIHFEPYDINVISIHCTPTASISKPTTSFTFERTPSSRTRQSKHLLEHANQNIFSNTPIKTSSRTRQSKHSILRTTSLTASPLLRH